MEYIPLGNSEKVLSSLIGSYGCQVTKLVFEAGRPYRTFTVGRTSTQGLKITEEKELALQ